MAHGVHTKKSSQPFSPGDAMLAPHMLWPGVCPAVCHKPVLYRNGWTD